MLRDLFHKDFSDRIGILYRSVVAGFFLMILLYLCFLSIISTSRINLQEHTLYGKDSILNNIAILLFFSVAGFLINRLAFVKKVIRAVNANEELYKTCQTFLLFVILIMGLLFVINAKCIPGSDQLEVQKAVAAIRAGDYHSLENNGYLGTYKNQLGLAGYSMLLAAVFGDHNYLAFQIMSVFLLILFYRELTESGREMGMKYSTLLMVLVSGILFFPLTMYTILVYGNIPGLACGMLAIRNEQTYFRTGKKYSLVLAAVGIFAAVLWKQNYLIFAIGMLLYAFTFLWGKQKKKGAMMLTALLLVVALQAILPVSIARSVSGKSLDQGMSKWAWVAMGLQDGSRAPGWYNSYSFGTYRDSDYHTDRQTETAKANIRKSLEKYQRDANEMVRFFTQKTASQWNNPTFQAFWNLQVRKRNADAENWTQRMLQQDSLSKLTSYLDVMQLLIIFGALLYAINKKITTEQNDVFFLPSVFVGGFLFHLIWEAKCQYTIMFFVLLLPCAAEGYSVLWEKTEKLCDRIKQKQSVRLSKYFSVILIVILFFASSLTILYTNDRIYCIMDAQQEGISEHGT